MNKTDNNQIQKQSLSKSNKLRKKIKDIRLADKPGTTLENIFLNLSKLYFIFSPDFLNCSINL